MEKAKLKVSGMMCDHCVAAVTKAVTGLSGIGGVQVDLKAGTVDVEYDPSSASVGKIRAAIEDQGYEVAA
ncbi:copper chaperone CopZ [Clostridia bacterium]|nr:copper chaperone CopZ [Clostridia bacterium]